MPTKMTRVILCRLKKQKVKELEIMSCFILIEFILESEYLNISNSLTECSPTTHLGVGLSTGRFGSGLGLNRTRPV